MLHSGRRMDRPETVAKVVGQFPKLWEKINESPISYRAFILNILNDFDIDELYDLRDWGLVVKRFPSNLPEGFDEFYDRVSKILLDIDSQSIYQLTGGI